MTRLRPFLLKKSICHSVAKFPSNSLALLGILIQISTPHDSVVSAQRNKIQRADFINRICPNAVITSACWLPS